MDDRLRFLVLLGKVYADLDVAALDLMVDCLADVVQQAGAACGQGIKPQFAGHHAGDMCNLDGVLQYVLTVAGTVTQTAEDFDQFGVDAVDAGLEGGALALALDDLLDLSAGLVDHFLDAGGMDAAVHDQLFERQTRDFAAHRVERGKGDRFGRVVDNQINARQRFERADIAALAANDAALHLIVGQRYNRNGCFGNMVGSAALDRGRDDLACGLLAFVLELLLDFAQLDGCIMRCLGFDRGNQHFARFVAGHAGDLFQLFQLLRLDAGQLFLFLLGCFQLTGQLFILAVERVALLVKRFLALNQAALELLGLIAALLQLAIGFGALSVDFILGFQNGFAFFGFTGFDGFVDDACRFGLGGADLLFCNALAVQETDDNAHNETHNTGYDRYDDVGHMFGVSSYFLILRQHRFGRKKACAVSFGKMERRFAAMALYMANHAGNNDKKWRNRPIVHKQTGAALRSEWRLKNTGL